MLKKKKEKKSSLAFDGPAPLEGTAGDVFVPNWLVFTVY